MNTRRILSYLAIPSLSALAFGALVQPSSSDAAVVDDPGNDSSAEPVENEQAPVGIDPGAGSIVPIDGYVETHVHSLGRYGFGGAYVHGEVGAGAVDPDTDLGPCTGTDHAISWIPADVISKFTLGLLDNKIGGEIDRLAHPLRTRGFNSDPGLSFVDWPIWSSVSHSQVHPNWIHELVKGETHEPGIDSPLGASLKVFVLSAVNFRPLCDLLDPDNRDFGDCHDDPNLERQIEIAWEMSDRGPDGSVNPGGFEWFQVVRSPSELRATVAQGKLAVILHLEASELMHSGPRDAPLSYRDIEKSFWRYHDLGVRSFQPVHELNNQFGGTAAFAETKILRAAAMLADAHRKGMDEDGESQMGRVLFSVAKLLGSRDAARAERSAQKSDPTGLYERYQIETSDSGYNTLGLTAKGNYLTRIAMCENVLIDTAHMGRQAFWDTWSAATDGYSSLEGEDDYPLFHSHTRFRSMQHPDNASEYNASDAQVHAVRDSGGMIGLRTGTTPVVDGPTSVPNDCQGTTKTWAQSYAYGQQLGVPMGIGTDMPTAVKQLRPRYADVASKWGQAHNTATSLSIGPHEQWACGSKIPKESGFKKRRSDEQALQDPSDQVGSDFDLIGLARYNLLDDLLIDVENLGQPVELVKNQSAEAFVSMWERAQLANATARNEEQQDLCTFVREDVDSDGYIETWEVVRDVVILDDDDMTAHLRREAMGAKDDRGDLDDWEPPRELKGPPQTYGDAQSHQPMPAPPPPEGHEDGQLPCSAGQDDCPVIHPWGEAFPPAWLEEWWMLADTSEDAEQIPELEPWQLEYLDGLELAPWVQLPDATEN